ncbi:MAG: NAD-dependent epimerase/dehydratase family protein [Chloroflexota bacterium]
MRVLVTGGAGFVGGNLVVALASRHPDWEVAALDNLSRRGSELNLPRLEEAGVEFFEGDVRDVDHLRAAGDFSALVECSAEPSVLAALSDPSRSFETNLLGAFNCLERTRRCDGFLVFLSTSRVYPIQPLRSLELIETATRFELAADQAVPGAGPDGVSEGFPLAGARTLYGATKLGAEHLIEEYANDFGVRAAVNRCGVVAGPWQMGRVDQGVFSWWLLAHLLDFSLDYIGFGGTGKQVRDLLHVADLVDLIDEQLCDPDRWSGVIANVGGGSGRSLSLLEATELCREITGNEVPIGARPATRQGDVPVYLSDCSYLAELTSWRPRRTPRELFSDMFAWAAAHEDALRYSLDLGATAR